jgi:hypothetical protein
MMVILMTPMIAHAKCHKIYSPSGELVYSSTELPFEYPRHPDTISSSVGKLVVGGHLVSGNDPTCPHVDKVTSTGKAKTQEIENEERALRENRERLRLDGLKAIAEREERERQRKIAEERERQKRVEEALEEERRKTALELERRLEESKRLIAERLKEEKRQTAERLEEEKRRKESESAYDFNSRVERLKLECATMLRTIPAWKDRDALKILGVDRDGFRTIRNEQNSRVVVQYSALVNAKNSFGGYIGEKLAFCYSDASESRIVSVSTLD